MPAVAPHHPTPEWIKKISDMHLFDDGWNKLRETIFANQKRLGVIPPDAKLTPRPKDLLKECDQCTPDEKKSLGFGQDLQSHGRAMGIGF